METNYEIDYNDKRLTEVEADKKAALNEVDVTYGNIINQSDQYYDKQIQASKDWADKQSQLQQEKTDFAIEQIEQQKDQTKKDYTKEQSGAYVDWQKQSDPHGVNAEKMAAQGLQNSGYSESSQVSMYNTYQNRVASARESYNRAVLNFNNSINEARLQNNSILAEIAAEALQKQLELSLQGFQYKNKLLLEKADKKTALESEYWGRYQDVLAQINHEKAMAEEIRQFNETMAYNKSKSSGYVGGGDGVDGTYTFTEDGIDPAFGVGSAGAENSGETTGDAKINTDSLNLLGLSGKSGSDIEKLESQGVITSTMKDGEVYFVTGPNYYKYNSSSAGKKALGSIAGPDYYEKMSPGKSRGPITSIIAAAFANKKKG